VVDRLRRDPGLPFQVIEGRAVIVVPARREAHQLDEVATFLWTCLERERTVGDLVAEVCGAFEVQAEAAERDVRDFVRLLEGKGLVVRA